MLEQQPNLWIYIQDEINMHNQERRKLMLIERKWCGELSKDNLKHKFYMANKLWETIPFPIINSMLKVKNYLNTMGVKK
jgi:hypothetical protein